MGEGVFRGNKVGEPTYRGDITGREGPAELLVLYVLDGTLGCAPTDDPTGDTCEGFTATSRDVLRAS